MKTLSILTILERRIRFCTVHLHGGPPVAGDGRPSPSRLLAAYARVEGLAARVSSSARAFGRVRLSDR